MTVQFGFNPIRKRWLKMLALVALAIPTQGGSGCGIGFGADDEVYDPGCTTDGSPVTAGAYEYCLTTRLIGKARDALIWTVPYTEPIPDSENFKILMPVVSQELDGATEVIDELDYL